MTRADLEYAVTYNSAALRRLSADIERSNKLLLAQVRAGEEAGVAVSHGALTAGRAMQSLDRDALRVRANLERLNRANLARLRRQVEGVTGAMDRAARAIAFVGGTALAGLSYNIIKAGINFDALKQRSTVAFQTLLGNAKQGRDMMADIIHFSQRTPFNVPGLIESSQQILALGFSGRQVLPILRRVGDATAALGGDPDKMRRIITALGQIQAKGRIQAEEMRQLTENGVRAWIYLARTMGVSQAQAMQMVHKNQVSAGLGLRAILNGMDKQFHGFMQQQSQTFTGALSNMVDILNMLAGVFVGPLFKQATGTLLNLQNLLRTKEARREVAQLGREFFGAVIPALKETVLWIIVNKDQFADFARSAFAAGRVVAQVIGKIADVVRAVAGVFPGGGGGMLQAIIGGYAAIKFLQLAASVAAFGSALFGLTRGLVVLRSLVGVQKALSALWAGETFAGAIKSAQTLMRTEAAVVASERAVGAAGLAAGVQSAEGSAIAAAGWRSAAASFLTSWLKVIPIVSAALASLLAAGPISDKIDSMRGDKGFGGMLTSWSDSIDHFVNNAQMKITDFLPDAITGNSGRRARLRMEDEGRKTGEKTGDATGKGLEDQTLKHWQRLIKRMQASTPKNFRDIFKDYADVAKLGIVGGLRPPNVGGVAVGQSVDDQRQLQFGLRTTREEWTRLQAAMGAMPAWYRSNMAPTFARLKASVAHIVDQDDVDRAQQGFNDLLQRAQQTMERLRSILNARRQRLDEAFSVLSDKVLQAFDAETTRLEEHLRATVKVAGEVFTVGVNGKTPAERELAALQRIDQMRNARRAVSDARAHLRSAQAVGDPHLIAAAQRELEDARSQVQQANLEKRADVERKAADKALERRKKEFEAERALEREHFEDRLTRLRRALESGRITQAEANRRIVRLMRDFGVTFAQTGRDMGNAFVTSIQESMGKVDEKLRPVNQAFKRVVSYRAGFLKLAAAINRAAKAFDNFNSSSSAGAGAAGGGGYGASGFGGGGGGGGGGGRGGSYFERHGVTRGGHGTTRGVGMPSVDPQHRRNFLAQLSPREARTPRGARQAGKRLAQGLFGWTGGQWTALQRLWTRESGWRYNATGSDVLLSNGRHAHAYGIPQSLPPEKMAAAGGDWRTNPITQIRWGLGYIKSRYRNPSFALAHSNRNNWYARGGHVPGHGSGDTVPAMLTPGEVVLNAKQQRQLGMQLGLNTRQVGRALFQRIQRFASGGVVKRQGEGKGADPPTPLVHPVTPGPRRDIVDLDKLTQVMQRYEARIDRHAKRERIPGFIELLRVFQNRLVTRRLHKLGQNVHADRVKGLVGTEQTLLRLITRRPGALTAIRAVVHRGLHALGRWNPPRPANPEGTHGGEGSHHRADQDFRRHLHQQLKTTRQAMGVGRTALRIVAHRYPYVWGGGHGVNPIHATGRPRGYDCSGFVGAALAGGGLWRGAAPVSGTLMGWGKPGRGGSVMVNANTHHVELAAKDAYARWHYWASRSRTLGGPQNKTGFSSSVDGDRMRVRHYATGGLVRGHGRRDTVPAMVSPGELILNLAQQRTLSRTISAAAHSGGDTYNISVVAQGSGSGGYEYGRDVARGVREELRATASRNPLARRGPRARTRVGLA